jgi:hypothetical protein
MATGQQLAGTKQHSKRTGFTQHVHSKRRSSEERELPVELCTEARLSAIDVDGAAATARCSAACPHHRMHTASSSRSSGSASACARSRAAQTSLGERSSSGG